MNTQPIGILDSGLGGLTIWKEIITLLPDESTIYIGDSFRTPYGNRSNEEIYALAKNLVDFLLTNKVKVIVVACNTISVACLDKLRSDYPNISFIGTVPAIKTAAAVTRNNHIGILSTTRTAESAYQKNLITEFAAHCDVTTVGTDELVPLIEEGEVHGRKIEDVLQNILSEFKQKQVDTLVLGCTHFPFVKDAIQKFLGNNVEILDSGAAIARQTQRILDQNNSLATGSAITHGLYTTGNAELMKLLAKKAEAGTIAKGLLVEHIDL